MIKRAQIAAQSFYWNVMFVGGSMDGSRWGLKRIDEVLKFGDEKYTFELADLIDVYVCEEARTKELVSEAA